jgi:hypothetical protein
MGGSGGYFNSNPSDIINDLRAAEDRTRDEAYEAKIADDLTARLVDFNNRDVSGVQRHLGEIEAALGKELAGFVDIVFGGSVSKRTYVEGLSDVDSLVMLDNCELADGTPADAKAYFVQRLKERFPNTAIREGALAVTVTFADAEIQLLPAISCRSAVKIADPRTAGWATVRPREFAAALSDVNEQAGGKVVPVIKLAKAIIANLPEQQRISGYHAESLAVALFREYAGPLRPKEMLHHYFSECSKRVLAPVTDRTGQSVHVDEYLGAAGSLERQIVADAFSRISRRMKNADVARSVDSWKVLFDEP